MSPLVCTAKALPAFRLFARALSPLFSISRYLVGAGMTFWMCSVRVHAFQILGRNFRFAGSPSELQTRGNLVDPAG